MYSLVRSGANVGKYSLTSEEIFHPRLRPGPPPLPRPSPPPPPHPEGTTTFISFKNHQR